MPRQSLSTRTCGHRRSFATRRFATRHCGETVGCRAQPWNTISLATDRFPGTCIRDSLLGSGLLLLCMWCSKQRSATLSSGHGDPNPWKDVSGPHFQHRIQSRARRHFGCRMQNRREITSEAGQLGQRLRTIAYRCHNSCGQNVRTKLAEHGLASCDELVQRIVQSKDVEHDLASAALHARP